LKFLRIAIRLRIDSVNYKIIPNDANGATELQILIHEAMKGKSSCFLSNNRQLIVRIEEVLHRIIPNGFTIDNELGDVLFRITIQPLDRNYEYEEQLKQQLLLR
jgi:hypothetical protein